MKLVLSYDPSTAAAPAAFFTALNYVVTLFDAMFTNDVTVDIDVGWGEYEGFPLDPGSIGESEFIVANGVFNYATVRSALLADAQSSTQKAAFATLPVADPTGGTNFTIATSEAGALGLAPSLGDSGGIDGYVGFSNTISYSFGPNYLGVPGAYNFIGLAEHEITEDMGRSASGTPMNLFRYSAAGTRVLDPQTSNSAGYFSINGGITDLDSWNTSAAAGDLGDWAGGIDAFDYLATPGEPAPLTLTDITLMNVLGWNTATPANTVPAGVTDFISSGQTHSGMTVASGGVQAVSADGTASGTIVHDGGEIVVSSGGTVSGLTLDNGATIDLPGVAATSATENGTAQLIVASGGSQVAFIGLAIRNTSLTFTPAPDGNGGTEITVTTSVDDQFNTAYYLAENPDVAAAVAAGIITAYQHYLTYGQYEGRAPNAEFDPGYYLANNPDVAAAVKAGVIASAFQHYIKYGIAEGRAGSAELAAFDASFNMAAYDKANPDVAAAVHAGLLKSGLEHYLLYGEAEGRVATDAAGTVITPGTILAVNAAAAPAAVTGSATVLSGNDTISVPGSTLFYAGTGTDSFTADSGHDVFVFDASRDQGGIVTVHGFDPRSDSVEFVNYTGAQLDAVTLPGALAAETAGSGTVLNLANDTTVTFLGVHLSTGNFES